MIANNCTNIFALGTEITESVPQQQKLKSYSSIQDPTMQVTPPSRQGTSMHEPDVFNIDIVYDIIPQAMHIYHMHTASSIIDFMLETVFTTTTTKDNRDIQKRSSQ